MATYEAKDPAQFKFGYSLDSDGYVAASSETAISTKNLTVKGLALTDDKPTLASSTAVTNAFADLFGLTADTSTQIATLTFTVEEE